MLFVKVKSSDLIISFTQKLQFLGFLVHEDPIQMSGLHTPDLYGFVAPPHDLTRPDVGHAGRQLSPLEHDVLGHLQGRVLECCQDIKMSELVYQKNNLADAVLMQKSFLGNLQKKDGTEREI